MSSAEESLMALLEAMLTLAARNVHRPPKPQVKPGGHQEEHFLDLTEDERNEFSCNICYQILKETMQCVNNHKFCHSCLLVWSTTGQYTNRIRCPVCRTHGYYFRNSDIDDRIGTKKVKCLMESCSWTGLLKYLGSHRHTTYSELNAQGNDEGSSSVTTMPRLAQASPHIPSNTSRFVGTGLSAQGTQDSNITPRYSLFPNTSLSRESPSSLSSSSQETIIEIPRRLNATSNTRYNSRAPLRRIPNVRASLNSRITFNHTTPNTDNNNNVEDDSPPLTDRSTAAVDNSDSSAAPVVVSGHTPRPPSGPRTTASTRRLPRLVNPPPPRSRYQPPETVALSSRTRSRPQENLVEIRDSLRESRNRLDSLMSSFSGELDSSRQEMVEFQQERERQRREQLEEVRELGQRLGQVASELRRLLEHRRFITSFSDNDDEDDEHDL